MYGGQGTVKLRIKRLLLISILFCLILTLLSPGCPQQPATEEMPPAPPITVELSFPDGAPPLSHEAKLNCVVKARRNFENMSVEIGLPEGFELVSGDLSWVGDIPSGDDLEVIRATVRAVKTGNWTIEATTYIDPEKHSGFGGTGRYPIYVSISEDSSEWGIYPPWHEGGGHPVPIEQVDERSIPIVDLSISHAPLLNEPAEITCTVTTLIDYPNMNAQVIFPYGAEATVVEGNLEWHGDLIANVPVTFSAQVVFTYGGYYEIGWRVWQTGKEYSWANPRLICLLIGEDESSFCEEPTPVLPPEP